MSGDGAVRFQLTRPLPALWRSPGVLQIGLDHSLLLEGVPTALADAVRLLDRPRTYEQILGLVPQLGAEWLSWLLARLHEAGLTKPGTSNRGGLIQVLGEGALARSVHQTVEAAGFKVRRIRNVDGRPADPDRLVILAGPTAEPDRAATDTLFRLGSDHLVVRIEPDRAVVGPLVRPGRTPCVRCQDLAVVRQDSAWPQLLAQLCRLRVEPDPVLLSWAAATAAAQLRAWAGGGPVDALGNSLELAIPQHQLQIRRWAAEGACACLGPP